MAHLPYLVSAMPSRLAASLGLCCLLAAPFANAQSGSERCKAHFAAEHAQLGAGSIDAEIVRFQSLAEEALAERERIIEGEALLRGKRDRGEALSGANLEALREGTLAHVRLRDQLIELAEQHECWLDDPQIGRMVREEVREQAVMMALASALLLYDNYLLAVSLFEQDASLRRIIDRADSGWGVSAWQMAQAKRLFLNASHRSRVKRAITHYETRVRPKSAQKQDPATRYLIGLIEQSPSYAGVQQAGVPQRVLGNIGLFNRMSLDSLSRLTREGVNLFSLLFGNTVGIVESRRGHLHGDALVHDAVLSELRPGDILLEKTPFRLTDALIPGYWGHAAIWLGSEAQLRELGLWEHPLLRPHQQAVREGRGVLEALRGGVTVNTLAHFMNVDDLLVLRDSVASHEEQRQRVLRGLRQIGKPYDFNFDVETTDKIVCSELIYQVFTEMDWPTSRALGRATISPDQIALRALPADGLQIVHLYETGKPVLHQPRQRLRALLGEGSGELLARR